MLSNEKDIFKMRKQSKINFLILFILLYGLSALISGFQNGIAFLSIPNGIIWLFKNFIPTASALKYFPKIMSTMLESVMIGITATVISSIFAIFLAIIGSETTGINKFLKIIIKVIASMFRNTPIVAWSILLLFSFKQSKMTGLIALVVILFGYMIRTFMETIDEVGANVREALEVTGANYFQIIFQGVIPSVSGQLVSWVLYYIENSIREMTLIGMLTGTGIGFLFNMYYRDFKYDVVGLIILIVVIFVIGIELISNKVRKELL